jgi:hypothetical protein
VQLLDLGEEKAIITLGSDEYGWAKDFVRLRCTDCFLFLDGHAVFCMIVFFNYPGKAICLRFEIIAASRISPLYSCLFFKFISTGLKK